MSETDVQDVDTDFELEDVEEVSDAPEANEEKAKAKKEKERTRGDLPEGYVTPIGLCKELNERNLGRDRNGNEKELKPQEVYSSIKNAPKDYAFPGETVEDSVGSPRFVVKLEAGVEWWEAKNKRTAERRENAAEKAAKKAEKASKKDEATEEVVDEAAFEEADA
jgi:hypothetical protein